MFVRKILGISGSSGFIGKRLIKFAAGEGYECMPIKLRSHMTRSSVMESLERLASNNVSQFIHLAWPASSTQNYKYSDENEAASALAITTAEICLEIGLNFYGMGSAAEGLDVANPYSASKSKTRMHLDVDISEGRLTWCRPYYVFDEYSWPLFVRDASQSGIVLIQDDRPRDFIHVDDVSSGLLGVIENNLRGDVNIASGLYTRPSELLGRIGLNFKVKSVNLQTVVPIPHVNISKLSLVGWSPSKTLDILKDPVGKQ